MTTKKRAVIHSKSGRKEEVTDRKTNRQTEREKEREKREKRVLICPVLSYGRPKYFPLGSRQNLNEAKRRRRMTGIIKPTTINLTSPSFKSSG